MKPRTILLNEKAYIVLKKIKQKAETYSDAIVRLVEEKEKSSREDILLKIAGSFMQSTSEWKRVEAEVARARVAHLASSDG